MSFPTFPSRLIPVSPLPRGFLPQKSGEKALAYLYPDEDARLLACPDVPTAYRLWYGFLAREGLRVSEAGSLTWAEVDFEHGAITLDKNKTDDPRAWALDPGVVRALRAWRSIRGAGPTDRVFLNTQGRPMGRRNAERFRAHLQKAGVERAELYQATAARQQIRAHDLRATFVTIHLANGRTETWIADRTGHRSSAMIAKYRRAARKVAELAMGGLSPLHLAIPELGAAASSGDPSAEGDGGNDRQAGLSPQTSPQQAPSTGTPRPPLGTRWASRIVPCGAPLSDPPKSSRIPSRCTRGESNPHALRRRNLKPTEGSQEGAIRGDSRESGDASRPSAHQWPKGAPTGLHVERPLGAGDGWSVERDGGEEPSVEGDLEEGDLEADRADEPELVEGGQAGPPSEDALGRVLVTPDAMGGASTPRAALLSQLAAAMLGAHAAGDTEGARATHAAIGALLALPVAAAVSSPASGAPVFDLVTERGRQRRGGGRAG